MSQSHVAHHYSNARQQFAAGNLGMWLFLTTEILLFSGLFCAYAVFRANHPEMFVYAHRYLSVPLGAANTLVLIFSSFTMASAVRAAQLGRQKWLVRLLAITLACGCVFLCVKFVEYKAKWEEGLLAGGAYRPTAPPEGAVIPAKTADKPEAGEELKQSSPTPAASKSLDQPLTGSMTLDHSTIAPAAEGPRGLSRQWLSGRNPQAAVEWTGPEPFNVQVFFGIYFAMTGLHGVHVLAGMGVIAWILIRARRGEFGPDYYNPVDFTGLYWHLVDMVWIFLFPLFYLIA
jgi:cytochrome c oxidase subunit III